MRRPVLLVLVAIVLGVGGLYLLRTAVVDAGGFTLGSSAAQNHLAQLVQDWRFPPAGALLLIVLLISSELYGRDRPGGCRHSAGTEARRIGRSERRLPW
jgi:hypothetical protein